MRVKLPERLRRDLIGDESGVTVLMVAVSILALFGGATIAVDAGNLWSTRRHVISASDASALAAASDYALGEPSGCDSADQYATANDADLVECDVTLTSSVSGYVTTAAREPVDFAFAGVLGFSDRTVSATTTAMWGLPSAVAGLRPFGLCVDDPHFQAWSANPRGSSDVVRVYYDNDPDDCGGAPGNWAIIDLDDELPVSNSDTKRWVRLGYGEFVSPGTMGGDPGAFSNELDPSLGAVQGEEFPIPLFDQVSEQGSTAVFGVVGFVEVQLFGWKTTGAEQDRYLEIRFKEAVAGGVGGGSGPDLGLRVVRICDVEPEPDPSHCTT